jgi:hypothetical protein
MIFDSIAGLASQAEKESNWWEAVRLWKCEGSEYGREQAAACTTIAEAVDLGDRYRALVGNAHERWENHEINNRELYEIQCQAHAEVYGK